MSKKKRDIDERIASTEEKIAAIDKNISELSAKRKNLIASLTVLKKDKAAQFGKNLMDELTKKEIPLNEETLQRLLELVQKDDAAASVAKDEKSEKVSVKLEESSRANNPLFGS